MKSLLWLTNSHFRSILVCLLFLQFSGWTHGQEKVKTHEGVMINGIKQWIGTVGTDDSKPVLLFLHGGPGSSSRNYSRTFIKHLKNDFVVAQWDQRETGITAYWGPYLDSLTLELYYQDTEEVVKYLLKKFKKNKLYLVGFSWGGFLGLHLAHEHPELVHAYISVSAMIYDQESQRLTLPILKEKARQVNKQQSLDELNRIELPLDNWQEMYYMRKWTNRYLTGDAKNPNYPKSLFEEWSKKWMPLYLEASKVDCRTSIKEIKCPIYFFASKNDFAANYKLTEDLHQSILAKEKELVWFSESGHEIPSQEPKKFSAELIRISNK